MRSIYLLTIAIFLTLGGLACHAAISGYSMWLTAHPQAIVADSHSATTITAELRDSSGNAVPNGTIVDFTSSLGIIERRALTSGGIARVRLESGTTTGTALVSAVAAVGNAVAQLRVDFLEPGTEMFDESFITVSSKSYLGYDSDSGIVDSAGGVTIYHRGVTINAQDAQIDVKANILRARSKTGGDNITVQRGDKKLEACALYYDLTSMRGVIVTPVECGAKRMLFRGRDLFTEPDKDPDAKISLELKPIPDSKLFIRAKSLIIKPGEQIKIKRASYYVEGDKLLSVPLQVVSLAGQNTGASQMITYGTEGLRLDLPLYFSLTPNSTGAVRLKRAEQTGWGYYSDRAGWQVDLDEDYNMGGAAGNFSLNRVTSREWGARWNQRTEFNNDSQLYTYLDFPSHRDLYSTVDYSRALRGYTWSVSFRGNKLKDSASTYSTSTYLQSRAKPLIGSAVTYAFTTRLSYANQLVGGSTSGLGTGVGLQLYGKTLQFGQSTSINSSMTIGRDWGGFNSGTSVYANASLFHALGKLGQVGLNYSYSWADVLYGYNAQRISANLSLAPSRKWAANLYTIYGLGDHSASAFGDFGYEFMPTWRLGLIGTYQKLQYASYSDTQIAVSKLIGRQEVRVTWSQAHRKLGVDFSAASF